MDDLSIIMNDATDQPRGLLGSLPDIGLGDWVAGMQANAFVDAYCRFVARRRELRTKLFYGRIEPWGA
jgi:hypothetical protein